MSRVDYCSVGVSSLIVLARADHTMFEYGAYRRNIDKHYVGFDLLQNTKFTQNDLTKVKMRCLYLSVVL